MPADPATKPKSEKPLASSTVAQYRKKASRLFKRCVAALETKDRLPSPMEFVRWTASQRPLWKPKTWNVNKSSVIHRLRDVSAKIGDATPAAEHERRLCEEAIGFLKAQTQAGCATESSETSATKLKILPAHDRLRIGEHLAGTRSPNAALLTDFLLAGVRSGLRPCEWETAREIGSSEPEALVIVVRNAKWDDLRAHGEFRTLTFTKLPDEERAAIRRWMTAARTAKSYVRLQKTMSDLLYVTCRTIWPRRKRHYTPYSARHEFGAIAKLVMDSCEVAAVMGHATDLTAASHYGRLRHSGAYPPSVARAIEHLPKPLPEEVERVRRRLAVDFERLISWKALREPGSISP